MPGEEAAGGGAGALGALGGALIGGLGSFFSASASNKAMKKIAREQMQFQERMSNTAHQREIKDLSKAGLNPMLSVAPGGHGASTPEGSQAGHMDEFGSAAHSVSSGVQAAANIKLIQAQTEAATATANNQNSQAAVNVATVPKIYQETETSSAQHGVNINQATLLTVQARKTLHEISKIMADTDLTHAQKNNEIERLPGISEINKHLQLATPQLRNMSNAQESDWMKNFAPYIDSILHGTGAAANLKFLVR